MRSTPQITKKSQQLHGNQSKNRIEEMLQWEESRKERYNSLKLF